MDQHTACGHTLGVCRDNRRHAASCTRLCNDCIWKRQMSWMLSCCLTTWTCSLAPLVWKPEAIGGRMVSLQFVSHLSDRICNTRKVSRPRHKTHHAWFRAKWCWKFKMLRLKQMIQMIGMRAVGEEAWLLDQDWWRLPRGDPALHRRNLHNLVMSENGKQTSNFTYFAHTLVN